MIPANSSVLTPAGWRSVKDLRAGDVVCSGDGKTVKIKSVSEPIKSDVYVIRFSDGTSVRCSKNQNLRVQDKRGREKREYMTAPLSSIEGSLYIDATGRKNWSTDFIKPAKGQERRLPLHPYLIGVILGNGQTSSGLVLSLYDQEMVEYLQGFFPSNDYHLHLKSANRPDKKDFSLMCSNTKRYTVGSARYSYIGYALYNLGLKGKKSQDKFIPDVYLHASVEQRLWLLRGLLDTDGYVGNSIEYSTVSPQLRDGVIELVRSLGGSANYIVRQGKYTKDGKVHICKKNYRVFIQFPSDTETCLFLSRKRQAYAPKRSSDTFKKMIGEIKYTGTEDCREVTLDEPEKTVVVEGFAAIYGTEKLS